MALFAILSGLEAHPRSLVIFSLYATSFLFSANKTVRHWAARSLRAKER
jgi:hypothetical protein